MVITPESPEENEVEKILSLLGCGVSRVHFRHPGMSEKETMALLEQIPQKFRHAITLHDYFNLAERYGCGIQINSRNNSIPNGVTTISQSCHSLDEAHRLFGIRDYVTLSPVFDSISKKGYSANCSLINDVKIADKQSLPPLIALGGITFEKLPALKEADFAGAAMLGAIWNTNFNESLNKIEALCYNS